MNKEQQIEEMAKDINNTWFVKSNGDICGTNVKLKKNDIKMIAHQLVLEGYRKLPEDSVVLSREEYEKLKSLYDTQKGAIMTSEIGDLPLTVTGLRKAVDEITRLNKVEAELQELNMKYYNEAKDLRRQLKEYENEQEK